MTRMLRWFAKLSRDLFTVEKQVTVMTRAQMLQIEKSGRKQKYVVNFRRVR